MTSSIYDDNLRPLKLDDVSTYPLASRPSKVSLDDFARPISEDSSLRDFLQSLPNILAVQSLRELAARMRRAFEARGLELERHVHMFPLLTEAQFMAVAESADVNLDSIGWSGGNTTLEALAQDLPVVTFQGELMRGRVSAGILRMMGMPETIAETLDDYVALAVRMGRDPDFRADIKKRIASDKHRLYRDRACIAALEDFLDRAARAQA